MILESVAQAMVESVAYPVLYVIGFLTLKLASLGRARILPLSERGYEREMRWYQFFVHRSGRRFWPPGSVMLVGAFVFVAIGVSAWLGWPHP